MLQGLNQGDSMTLIFLPCKTKRPTGKRLVDKTHLWTKHICGQNIPVDKTSCGQNIHVDKMSLDIRPSSWKNRSWHGWSFLLFCKCWAKYFPIFTLIDFLWSLTPSRWPLLCPSSCCHWPRHAVIQSGLSTVLEADGPADFIPLRYEITPPSPHSCVPVLC